MGEEIRARRPSGSEAVVVTDMSLDDLQEVLAIEEESFPTPWSERAFTSELTENCYARYIVAKAGERVVGYAGMWVVLDEAHITNIAVDPRYRGQNIGDTLLRELMARAKKHGARRMTLEVRKSNIAAQRLYEKQGFVKRGVRKGYYSDTKEDAIVMWKYTL